MGGWVDDCVFQAMGTGYAKLRGQRKYGDSVADKRPLWKMFGV